MSGVVMPTGVICPTAQSNTSTPPDGWLFCDGSSQLRATYPALFTVIGTTYGSVDGTHFTLPDLRGRVIVTADNSGGSDAGRLAASNTLGTTGGVETYTLTAAESGTTAHTHGSGGSITGGTSGQSAPHNHGAAGGSQFVTNVPVDGFANITSGGGGFGNLTATGNNSVDHTHTLSGVTDPATPAATPASASSAHQNMPPYIILNSIIKT